MLVNDDVDHHMKYILRCSLDLHECSILVKGLIVFINT